MNYSWGINLHGQKFGGLIMPEMMRWLWRDGPVSTDPNDMMERAFRRTIARRERPIRRDAEADVTKPRLKMDWLYRLDGE